MPTSHHNENASSGKEIIIGEWRIRQDAEGRYNINDLHKAAGGEKRHQPSDWLRSQSTVELINELETPGFPGVKPVETKMGRHGGTFVCKELAVAYASWINAAFHLLVLRLFIDKAGQVPVGLTSTAYQMTPIDEIRVKLSFVAEARRIGGKKAAFWAWKESGLPEFPQDTLPPYLQYELPLKKKFTITVKEGE